MGMSEIFSGLVPAGRLRLNEGLDRHTTYRVGGPADVMCLPETRSELLEIVTAARVHEVPWLVLGNGSNILFSDDGFRGLVIKIRGSTPAVGTLWHLKQEGECLRAGAGVSLPRLAWSAAAHGTGRTGVLHRDPRRGRRVHPRQRGRPRERSGWRAGVD